MDMMRYIVSDILEEVVGVALRGPIQLTLRNVCRASLRIVTLDNLRGTVGQ
jgi:hypothetical protein